MVVAKSGNSAWSDVKSAISGLNEGELLALVADLYRLSKENRTFLHTRFSLGDFPLGEYMKKIEDCMCPDINSRRGIKISEAKKAITAYSKASGDKSGETELMVWFVECGNHYTVCYGDMDGGFYDALNRMYEKAVKRIAALPAEERGEFQERLKDIMESANGIGWGYYDILREDYCSAFPGGA